MTGNKWFIPNRVNAPIGTFPTNIIQGETITNVSHLNKQFESTIFMLPIVYK